MNASHRRSSQAASGISESIQGHTLFGCRNESLLQWKQIDEGIDSLSAPARTDWTLTIRRKWKKRCSSHTASAMKNTDGVFQKGWKSNGRGSGNIKKASSSQRSLMRKSVCKKGWDSTLFLFQTALITLRSLINFRNVPGNIKSCIYISFVIKLE